MTTRTPDAEIRALAEAARAWRHGNCSEEELVQLVDELEAAMPDPSLDLTEVPR